MRFAPQTTGNPRVIDCDPGSRQRDRSCPVKLSILSRELLVAILLIGVASYLVSMAQDGMMESQPAKQSLRGHDKLLERLIYAEDGRALISCGWDKHVRFWNLAADQPEWGREMDSLPHNWPVLTLAITDDGMHLAAGGAGGFRIWTRPSKNGSWEVIEEHRGGTYRCLAASPDNRTLAVAGCDAVVRLWDIPARKEKFILDRFGDDLRMIAFSPSGSFFAASAFSGEFRIWDLKSSARPRALAGGPESVQSFALAPDDRTLAVAQSGPRATALGLWDVQTGNCRLPLSQNLTGNNTLAFSADGRLLASADRDSTSRFWDTGTGELQETLHDGVGWVKTLAFAPDGRQIAFGGGSGSIQFRNLPLKGSPQTQPHGS
jgi:WD40 repeat protein